MAHLYYTLGPWRWIEGKPVPHWAPPPGTVASLELATVLDMAHPGSDRGVGFFATEEPLDSAYTPLGRGDLRELTSDARMRSAFEDALGYAPQGATLVELLVDCLTVGADPTGQSLSAPLIPTVQGHLELHLGGHGLVYSRPFRWGSDPHTAQLQAALQAEFRVLFAAVERGDVPLQKAQQVLGGYKVKYGRALDWRVFVPADVQAEIPGDLPPQTTITDDFNRADADPLGSSSEGWSWTEVAGDQDIVSNEAKGISFGSARAESALSSADHAAQTTMVTTGGGCGPSCRYSGIAETHYALFCDGTADRLFRFVAGGLTVIASGGVAAAGSVVKIQANGTTIKAYDDGVEYLSVTDVVIGGTLFTGILSDVNGILDNFSGFDLAAAGVVGPLLGGRLVKRGIVQGRLVG